MNKGFSKERAKRVNWSPGDNFCQVKKFGVEDPPSHISSEGEDHLRNKVFSHSNGTGADSLPSALSKEHSRSSKEICIPKIKWKSPPLFVLKSIWQVAAGEESKERYRETKVLGASYPRTSAVPRSPRRSPESEASDYDDAKTPTIPLIPIEEKDSIPTESIPIEEKDSIPTESIPIEEKDSIPTESTQCPESVKLTAPTEPITTVNDKFPGLAARLGVDVNAAVEVALTALLKSNEKGSLVDTDLLIKILNDPKLVETLSKVSGLNTEPCTVTSSQQAINTVQITTVPCTVTSSQQANNTDPCTVTSSQQAIQTVKPLPTYVKPHPDASSVGISQRSESGRKGLTASSSGISGSMNGHSSSSDLLNARTLGLESSYYSGTSSFSLKPMDNILDLSRKVLPASGSGIFGPDRLPLPNPRIFDPRSLYLKPYSDASSSSVSGNMGLYRSSSIYGSNAYSSDLFNGPDRLSVLKPQTFCSESSLSPLASTTRADDWRLASETHLSSGSFPPRPSVTMPVIKDNNYYKSLVRLHGSGQEQKTAQYQVSASEMRAVPTKKSGSLTARRGAGMGQHAHMNMLHCRIRGLDNIWTITGVKS